jgi:hypothetical protein
VMHVGPGGPYRVAWMAVEEVGGRVEATVHMGESQYN